MTITHTDLNQPEVILSTGNIRHFHHAAIALHHAGYLRRSLFSTGYTNPKSLWVGLLPEYLQKFMRRWELIADLTGVARFAPLSELISRSLQHSISCYKNGVAGLLMSCKISLCYPG